MLPPEVALNVKPLKHGSYKEEGRYIVEFRNGDRVETVVARIVSGQVSGGSPEPTFFVESILSSNMASI
jgi:hypothetical protein